MSSEFRYLSLFHALYCKSFEKPSDALVLVLHWCLIRNRFKCDVAEELLPKMWNSEPDYYELTYVKYEVKFKLEIYVLDNLIHVQLRRLTDFADSVQQIKINDHVNTNQFKNENYHLTYKNLESLFKRFQWTIDHFRDVSNRKESFKVKNEKNEDNTYLMCTYGPNSFKNKIDMKCVSYADLLLKIKEENKTFDHMVENDKLVASSSSCDLSKQERNEALTSMSNATSHHELKENENQNEDRDKETEPIALEENKENDIAMKKDEESRKEKEKKQRKGMSKLFDYNPITNYFNYNQRAERKQVDQKLIEDNEYIKQAFDKYNLKPCNVNLVDCFGVGFICRTESTIKITQDIKEKLGIVDQPEKKYAIQKDSKKTRKSIAKVEKQLVKEKKSLSSPKLFESQSISNLDMTIKEVSLETTSLLSETNNDLGRISSIQIRTKKRGRKRKILDTSMNLSSSTNFINFDKTEIINLEEEVLEVDDKKKTPNEFDDEIIELDCPHQSLESRNYPIVSNRKLDLNNSINNLNHPRKRLKCNPKRIKELNRLSDTENHNESSLIDNTLSDLEPLDLSYCSVNKETDQQTNEKHSKSLNSSQKSSILVESPNKYLNQAPEKNNFNKTIGTIIDKLKFYK